MPTRPQHIKDVIRANIAQWNAEQGPIAPQDQRTIERWQNKLIHRLLVENRQLSDEQAFLRSRLDTLEAKLDQRPDWNLNAPKFPYKVLGHMPYRRTHWEGCQAVHSECGGDVPFQQQNLFDPAPDPIDAAREYPARDGKGDETC
jgi:hypothetical protein